MIESLLKELEDLVGSDYFEFDSEEIMDKIESEGAGPEIIEDIRDSALEFYEYQMDE